MTGGRGGRRDRDRLFGSHTRNGQPGQCGEALRQVEEMAGRHTRAARACHLRVGDHRRSQAPLRTPIVISSSDSSDSSSDRSTSSATSTAGPAAIVVGRCIALLGVLRSLLELSTLFTKLGCNLFQRSIESSIATLTTMRCVPCALTGCVVCRQGTARARHTPLCRHRVPQLTHTNHAHATPLPPPRYTTQHACTYLTLPLQRLRLPAAPRRRAGQDGGGQQGGPRRPRRRPWPRQGDEGI